ncbi:hypothetical protein N5J07_16530, partial [Comamonas aquatica]|uniref:hypothetical protein n=1 Tax=Comamonas aquatica TaxID=225991 RepID=UPI00244A826E
MNTLFYQEAKLFSGFSAHIDVTHYVAEARMMVSINKEKPSWQDVVRVTPQMRLIPIPSFFSGCCAFWCLWVGIVNSCALT